MIHREVLIPGTFYVSPETVSCAQLEGAEYLRVLDGLMNEMRWIHPESDVSHYLIRFTALYEKIYIRIMLILLSTTDPDDLSELEKLQSHNNEYQRELIFLQNMVELLNTKTTMSAFKVVFCTREWVKKIYQLADDIFSDCLLGSDNKLLVIKNEK